MKISIKISRDDIESLGERLADVLLPHLQNLSAPRTGMEMTVEELFDCMTLEEKDRAIDFVNSINARRASQGEPPIGRQG